MVLRLGGSAVPRSRAGVVARALLGFVPGGRLQSTLGPSSGSSFSPRETVHRQPSQGGHRREQSP
jgi:hypothetical protein